MCPVWPPAAATVLTDELISSRMLFTFDCEHVHKPHASVQMELDLFIIKSIQHMHKLSGCLVTEYLAS